VKQIGYIMRFVMNPDMVYHYPIWAVGLLLVGAAMFGAALLELCARRLLGAELRQRHNDVAAAIFSIIGVTYAVLLAFVAMLAWDGFNRAEAASYAEAALIGNVYNLSAGFADPERTSIRNEIVGYARRVVTVEWPAQAEGRIVDQDSSYLSGLNKLALALHPSSEADGDLHMLLLQAIERLWDARQERLLAAQSTIPDIVWFVLVVGGALTVAFGSFLGAPSLRMQLAMSAVLAASGALVLIMIIALSNPFRGDFRVSTAPFEHVLSRMEASAGQ
jgi:small-conductance mechanosensitive channel